MTNSANKYLYDIKKSLEAISFHLGEIKTIELFKKNLTVKRAVEREIEIIGEAMNSLLSINPEIQISDARKIIGMRNRIIHGYDFVKDNVIWDVITVSIPILKSEVEKYLEGDK